MFLFLFWSHVEQFGAYYNRILAKEKGFNEKVNYRIDL
tara:strand:+ start:7914 stop:8027 length:114 start_codon:yes stop_codon:yes gene_type:complete